MSFTQARTKSIGGRLLAYQEQENHKRRLNQIKSKQPTLNFQSTPSLPSRTNTNVYTKQQIHQNEEHRRNIKHLLDFISRDKNMSDRLKDPHDFFAYPALFFRQEKPTKKKTATVSHKEKPKARHEKPRNCPDDDLSQQSEYTRRYGIDLPTVKHLLPTLQQFSQEEMELLGDCINRIIMNYNLNSVDKIAFLKECVLKTAQPHYPHQFAQLIDDMFQDVLAAI